MAVHIGHEIGESADFRHVVALAEVDECVDAALAHVFRRDGQGGAVEEGGEYLLDKNIERTYGILQHHVARSGVELLLKGFGVVYDAMILDHNAFRSSCCPRRV